jgi:hypothetical protein
MGLDVHKLREIAMVGFGEAFSPSISPPPTLQCPMPIYPPEVLFGHPPSPQERHLAARMPNIQGLHYILFLPDVFRVRLRGSSPLRGALPRPSPRQLEEQTGTYMYVQQSGLSILVRHGAADQIAGGRPKAAERLQRRRGKSMEGNVRADGPSVMINSICIGPGPSSRNHGKHQQVNWMPGVP